MRPGFLMGVVSRIRANVITSRAGVDHDRMSAFVVAAIDDEPVGLTAAFP